MTYIPLFHVRAKYLRLCRYDDKLSACNTTRFTLGSAGYDYLEYCNALKSGITSVSYRAIWYSRSGIYVFLLKASPYCTEIANVKSVKEGENKNFPRRGRTNQNLQWSLPKKKCENLTIRANLKKRLSKRRTRSSFSQTKFYFTAFSKCYNLHT